MYGCALVAGAIGESAPIDESFKSSMWWLQRAATVGRERSAHRTLHSSCFAKRTANAQYDEAACRYSSWSASGAGDGQGDF
jgi:hemolysin-activating ACP:hemolysin acyltransferase